MKKLLNRFVRSIASAKWLLTAELLLTPVLLALSAAWLRIPDASTWQLILWVLSGALLLAVFLCLQAATMRALMNGVRGTRFYAAVLWLSGCGILVWIACSAATHWHDQIDLAAAYLYSRLPAGHLRTAWLTREHIATFLGWTEWALVWVVIPGLFFPLALLLCVDGAKLPPPAGLNLFARKRGWIAALLIICLVAFALRTRLYGLLIFAAFGFLVPDLRAIFSVWRNGRWWPPVLLCGYAWTHWMLRAFHAEPQGSVHEQIQAVIWKTVLAYGIGIFCWLTPMIWAAVLLDRPVFSSQPEAQNSIQELPR
jgi:hypothetical protein